MGRITKVEVEHNSAKWLFAKAEDKSQIIQKNVNAGDIVELYGEGLEWIITDRYCDVLQGSQKAYEIDILDQDGFLWVTDLAYKYGRKICKRTRRAFNFRIEADKLMQRAMSA
jgi:hypothetical protein